MVGLGCLCRRRLAIRRSVATEHAIALANEPCGIHVGTLERADEVARVLSYASDALEHESCPVALASTFCALGLLGRRQPAARSSDDALCVDLLLDARLRTHHQSAHLRSECERAGDIERELEALLCGVSRKS